MAHAFSASIWEAEDWGLWVQGQPELNSETPFQRQASKQPTPKTQPNKQPRRKAAVELLAICSHFFWFVYALLCLSSWMLKKKVTHLKGRLTNAATYSEMLNSPGNLERASVLSVCEGRVETPQQRVYTWQLRAEGSTHGTGAHAF